MSDQSCRQFQSRVVVLALSLAFVLAGCNPAAAGSAASGAPPFESEGAQISQTQRPDFNGTHPEEEFAEAEMLHLPELDPVERGDEPLQVVATTSIIGDVVAQIGGEAIALTTLIGPGQDPHSYEPAARDLTAVADAHVIFVNGWDLEEGLAEDLEKIGKDVPIVPISAKIRPLIFGADRGHENGEGEAEGRDHNHRADPHVWFSLSNVKQWAQNVQYVLAALDPANAGSYAGNAAAYLSELDELETYTQSQLASLPEERRFLVTNHYSFGYFAHEYHFTVLGTVIPGASTLAEPSARDLADLIDVMEAHEICTIFTETTVNDSLAQTVAAELDACETVAVLRLYTGALGSAGSGAETFIGMFSQNLDTIVNALR